VAAAVVTVLVVASTPAGARDGSYGPSGTFVVDPFLADGFLDQAEFRCPKPDSLPPPPKRPKALKDAQGALKKIAGAKALRAFGKSRADHKADAIPASVMTALATGRPAAALAASLSGAELEPKQPRHLVNAAVILIGYGKLEQADGLLAAAGKVGGSGAALGMTAPQQLAAAKAELDVGTGHFSAAETIYRKLLAKLPGMLALDDGLAQSLECQGKRGPAAARRSRAQREMFDYVAEDDPGGDSLPPDIDAGSVDEPSGKDIVSFGGYYHPRNQDDAAAHAPQYQQATDAAHQRAMGFQNQAFSAAGGTSRAGTNYLNYANRVVERDKELARLQAKELQIAHDYSVATGQQGEAQPPCYFSNQHAALWAIVDRTHTNHAELARRSHRLYTALAAGVFDPPSNRMLNLLGDSLVSSFYSSALARAVLVSKTEAQESGNPDCRATSEPAPGTGSETSEDSAPASDPCSAAKYQRIKVKLGSSASAEFNCEGGKVEVVPGKWGIDQAYIGGFGEVGVKWKSGDVTGVTGVKVAIGTKDLPGLPEVGVSGKAGVYVTAGPTKPDRLPTYGETRKGWSVKDWGVRLQATAEVPGPKAGVVSTITKFDNKVDISLVGVFN
jgi:hypothetical protein